MADVGLEACPYCAKVLSSKSERSRSTHVGICRAKQLRSRHKGPSREVCHSPQRGALENDQTEEQQPFFSFSFDQQQDEQHAEPSAFFADGSFSGMFSSPLPDAAQANGADLAWLKVYFERRDMSCSLLDDIFPLCGMTPVSHFISGQSLFAFVDALPGPEFHVTSVTLPGIPEPFDFAYRSITDVVVDLIRQHNGAFINPSEPRDMSTFGGEFTHGSRFRELQEKLSSAAGPRAVLMPVILNSGTVACSLPPAAVIESSSFLIAPNPHDLQTKPV